MHFLSLIYSGPGQIVPGLVAVVVWIGLAGIGYLACGRGSIVEVYPVCGWAVVASLFTIVGVFVPGSFLILSLLCGIVAVAGLAAAMRRRDPLFVPGSWRIVLLAMPLLLIAGTMEASQWDEFSHWLPAVRFLLVNDGFATPDNSFTGYLGYPYAWPILQYLAGRLAGRQIENIGSMFNIFMLLSLATFALRTARTAFARSEDRTIGWSFATASALIATALNPTFVQKLVLTAYSDISAQVATGVSILLAHRWLESLARRDAAPAKPIAWQLGLVLALLINTRQANLVIVVILLVVMLYICWRDPAIEGRKIWADLSLIILPPLAVYLAWRFYVLTVLVGIFAEESLRPIATWNFSLIPGILAAMLKVAWQKFAFFAPLAVCSVVALRTIIHPRGGLAQLLLFCGALFCGYNAFLFLTYLGSFGALQATTAVSYWRYNIDTGGTIIVLVASCAVWLLARRPGLERILSRWSVVALALVLILPFAFVSKIRFDLEAPKPFYNAVAKEIAAMPLGPGDLYVVDPTGTGEAAVITRYRTEKPGKSFISAFTPTDQIAGYFRHIGRGDYVLIHSMVAEMNDLIGVPIDEQVSYLFQRDADGWHEVRHWQKPAALSVH